MHCSSGFFNVPDRNDIVPDDFPNVPDSFHIVSDDFFNGSDRNPTTPAIFRWAGQEKLSPYFSKRRYNAARDNPKASATRVMFPS